MRRQRTTTGAPLGRIVLAQLGILLLRFRLVFSDRLLERFQAQLQLLLRQALGPGAEIPPSRLSSRWRSLSFCVSKVSRSVTTASRSANVASTSARKASTVSGRLCVLSGSESITCESYAATVGLRIPFIV
jgi:hypothetical protein